MSAEGIDRIERVVVGVWGEIRTLDDVVDMSTEQRIAFRSDIDLPLLNMVLAADLGMDVARAAEQVVSEFAAYGRTWTWWITPTYRTPALTDVLTRHGLAAQAVLGVERPLSRQDPGPLGPVDFEFATVVGGDPAFVPTLVRAYGIPEETGSLLGHVQRSIHRDTAIHVVAYSDGEPVGTGSGFIVGDCMEIHNVSSTRGDEVREATIAHLISAASERGCGYATGLVDPDELAAYVQAGFEHVCDTTHWTWRPPSAL